jgi:hypothetical protein
MVFIEVDRMKKQEGKDTLVPFTSLLPSLDRGIDSLL